MKGAAATLDITPAEFERGYTTFQQREARDPMYRVATFLVNHFWGKPRDMAEGIGALLLTWHQAFYRYGSFDFRLLEEALSASLAVIEQLRPRQIQSLAEADEPVIHQLFSSYLDALRVRDGGNKGRRSPVAAAKALHLLAPEFFPLWDEKIARAYACHYKTYPERKYVAFSQKMRSLAVRLESHAPQNCGRTFLKLIDEYNYARYTKAWIQPEEAKIA